MMDIELTDKLEYLCETPFGWEVCGYSSEKDKLYGAEQAYSPHSLRAIIPLSYIDSLQAKVEQMQKLLVRVLCKINPHHCANCIKLYQDIEILLSALPNSQEDKQ